MSEQTQPEQINFLDLQQTIEALEMAIDGGGLESVEQAELVGRSAHHHLVDLAAEVEFQASRQTQGESGCAH